MASQDNKPIMVAQQNGALPTVADSSYARSAYYMPGALVPSDGGNGQNAAGGVTFAGLQRAFLRRWPLALGAAAAAAVVVVGIVLFLMPPRYNTSVRFLIPSGNTVSVVDGMRDNVDFTVLKSNQAALIKGPAALKIALEQKTPSGKDVQDLSIVRAKSDPIAWLEGALKVDYPSPEIMRVSLAADNAEEVANLLNAVADGLMKVNRAHDSVERQRLIEELGKKKRDLENELSAKRAEFDRRAKGHDEKARDEAYKGAQEVARDARKTLRTKEIDLEVAKEQLKGTKARIANIGGFPAPAEKLDEFLRMDPRGAALFKNLEKAQSDIVEIKRVTDPRFAGELVRKAERERDSWLKAIAEQRERLKPELEARYREMELSRLKLQVFDDEQRISTLERLITAFDKEVTKAEEQARKISPSAIPMPPELKNLQDNIESMKGVRDTVAKTIALMEAEPYRPRVQLQSSALAPSGKDVSRQVKFAGAGAFGFFILVLFGVTWLEFRSQKIGEAEDLVHTGINLVGTIPNMPLSVRQQNGGELSAQDTLLQGQLSESVDSIRTLLLHVSRSDSLRVLMVTSASSGEGKTSLASQLAASLARAWRKTLLIDGDLRHPAGHALFGLPLEPGFSEVLRNEVKPADAIKPTPLSRLWMMPAGHFDTHAVQALAQDNVRTLLEQLKQEYDFIIIDSCPVLPVADSLLLGQNVDGVVFSVLRDVSRLPALHAAYQKMNNLNIRTLGAVVIGAKGEAAYAK